SISLWPVSNNASSILPPAMNVLPVSNSSNCDTLYSISSHDCFTNDLLLHLIKLSQSGSCSNRDSHKSSVNSIKFQYGSVSILWFSYSVLYILSRINVSCFQAV